MRLRALPLAFALVLGWSLACGGDVVIETDDLSDDVDDTDADGDPEGDEDDDAEEVCCKNLEAGDDGEPVETKSLMSREACEETGGDAIDAEGCEDEEKIAPKPQPKPRKKRSGGPMRAPSKN